MLRKAHKNNLNPETGGLSSSPVGVSKRRRIAGPRAADRKTLLKMATEETFLEQIIAQAQHVVLRLRAMFVLDQVSQNLRDPLINFHWSTLSSPTRTSVKVSLQCSVKVRWSIFGLRFLSCEIDHVTYLRQRQNDLPAVIFFSA